MFRRYSPSTAVFFLLCHFFTAVPPITWRRSTVTPRTASVLQVNWLTRNNFCTVRYWSVCIYILQINLKKKKKEVQHKQHLVYCVRGKSVGCTRNQVEPVSYKLSQSNFKSCLNFQSSDEPLQNTISACSQKERSSKAISGAHIFWSSCNSAPTAQHKNLQSKVYQNVTWERSSKRFGIAVSDFIRHEVYSYYLLTHSHHAAESFLRS
jgi:hypothetical protein